MRSGIWLAVSLAAFSMMVEPQAHAAKGLARSKARPTLETVKRLLENRGAHVQVVTFPDTAWSPIRVVRGDAMAYNWKPGDAPADKAETAEIITFGDSDSNRVRVLRGDSNHAGATSGQRSRAAGMTSQLVAFAEARVRPVMVLRGSIAQLAASTELFGSAREPDLDRVAFAVDGAESGHGSDPRMWRPEPSGPQGPMQVSEAAAADLGGGNRFDFAENRHLGRAYLARLYRRYGNWPDAVAAYNWGPGNVDSWIASGRPLRSLPLEVERYRNRVLREVGFDQAARRTPFEAVPQSIEFTPADAW